MLIAIKGAGDLATGIACRLHRCGFQIVCTDIEKPTTVRCTVHWLLSQQGEEHHCLLPETPHRVS